MSAGRLCAFFLALSCLKGHMNLSNGGQGSRSSRIRIQNPTIKSAEEEKLWRDVHKYAQLIPFEPEPNMGRLDEIKDEIKKGTYLKPEMLEETVARLAIRFMTKE